MRNQAQVLLKRSCTLAKLVNAQIKEITLLSTGKNNICVSCILNGFKYILKSISDTYLTHHSPGNVFRKSTNDYPDIFIL